MNIITAAALCFALQSANDEGRIKMSPERVEFACSHTQEIVDAGNRYDIDPVIMASLIYYESRYVPTAVSRSNACGLTQVIPKYVPETCEELKDPSTSINAGTRSLNYWIKQRKKKTYEVALACYNAGNACQKNSYGRSYSYKVRRLAQWLTKKATAYVPTKNNVASHWVPAPHSSGEGQTLSLNGWVTKHNNQGGSHVFTFNKESDGLVSYALPRSMFYQPIIGPLSLDGFPPSPSVGIIDGTFSPLLMLNHYGSTQ